MFWQVGKRLTVIFKLTVLLSYLFKLKFNFTHYSVLLFPVLFFPVPYYNFVSFLEFFFFVLSPVARQYNSAVYLCSLLFFLPLFVTDTLPVYSCPFLFFLPLFVTDTLPVYSCPFLFFLSLFVTDTPPTNSQNWLCFQKFPLFIYNAVGRQLAISRHKNAGWKLCVWTNDMSKNSPYGSALLCALAHERVNWNVTFYFGLYRGG